MIPGIIFIASSLILSVILILMLSNFPAIILAPNDIPARIISASDSYPYNIANKIVPERD